MDQDHLDTNIGMSVIIIVLIVTLQCVK